MKINFNKSARTAILIALAMITFQKGFSQTYINVTYQNITSSTNGLSFDVYIQNYSSNPFNLGQLSIVYNFPTGTISPTSPVPTVTFVKDNWWTGTFATGFQNSGTGNLLKVRAVSSNFSPTNGGPQLAAGVTQKIGRFSVTTTNNSITITTPENLIPSTGGNPTFSGAIAPNGGTSLAISVAGGGIGFNLPPLPVELTDFSATAQRTTNLLRWSTESEINSQHHIVERSADGIVNWSEIGRRQAAGTTQEKQRYNLADEHPLPISYYRLKMVDFDGQFEYSKIVNVEREVDGFAVTNVFPVPTERNVTLQVSMVDAANLTVTVNDLAGRIVSIAEMDADAGINNLEFDVSGLAAGTYFVKIDNGVRVLTEQIVKQ